jgi:hypothetical protein
MIRLSHNAGRVTLTLLSPSRKKDAPDVETEYSVRIVPSTQAAWVVLLRKNNGTTYNVVLDRASGWSCNCKAYQFGAGKPCKHIDTVAELGDILDAFADPVDGDEHRFTIRDRLKERDTPTQTVARTISEN